MTSFWRDIGSALGFVLPSDEEMGFGPPGPGYKLNERTGNWEELPNPKGEDRGGNKVKGKS